MTGTLFPFLPGSTPGLAGAVGAPPATESGASGSQPFTPRPAFENALSAAREDLHRPFTPGSGGSGQSGPELGSMLPRETPEPAAEARIRAEESTRGDGHRNDTAGRPARGAGAHDAENRKSADPETGTRNGGSRETKESGSGSRPASDPQVDPDGSAAVAGADDNAGDDAPAAPDSGTDTAENRIDGQAPYTRDDPAADQADITARAAADGEEMHGGQTAAARTPGKTADADQSAPGRAAALAAAGDTGTGARPPAEEPVDGPESGFAARAGARVETRAPAGLAGPHRRPAGKAEADSAAAPKAVAADGVRADTTTEPGGLTKSTHASENFTASLAEARSLLATHATRMIDAAAASENLAGPRPAAALPYRGAIPVPVSDPAFSGRFAAEVALLGAAGIERAEIRLHPRELGPVRIELSMNGDAARIAFSAAHPDTRQAIEQSLPLLKDLLAERGLQLGNADVSDHGGQSREHSSAGGSASGPSAPDGTPFETDRHGGHTSPRASMRRALLSIYA